MGISKRELEAYERRLLDDKKQLHKLMYESKDKTKEANKYKLTFYENELKYMQRQYINLYVQVMGEMPQIAKDKSYSLIEYDSLESMRKVETTPKHDDTPISTADVVSGVPTMQEYDTYVVKEIPNEEKGIAIPSFSVGKEKKNKYTDDLELKDIEKIIGRNFMGIAAAALIFIAVIILAGSVLPNITDEIKMVAMYILGAVFLSFGFMRIGKNTEDKFALVLLGCGAGVIYISLILSNIYFKVIGDIPLYALILLWSVGIVYLSRYKSGLFMAIGHIGITISMAFGAISCIDTKDSSMLVALIIFYIISAGVFNVAFYNKDIVKNIFNHAMNTINIMLLYSGMVGCLEEGLHIAGVLIIIISITVLGLILSSDVEFDEYYILPICLAVNLGFLSAEFGFVINSEVNGIIIYLASMAILVLLERKKWGIQGSKIMSLAVAMIFTIFGLYQIDVLIEHFVPLMVIVPFLIYGYYKRDDIFKYGALIIFAGYEYILSIEVNLHMGKVSCLELYGVGLVILIGLYLCIYFFKSQYNIIFKSIVHVQGCIHLLFIGYMTFKFLFNDGDVGFGIAYIMATIFNLIMLKVFCKDFENDEKEENTVFVAINAVLMIFALASIVSITVEPLHICIIMTAIVSFMVNCKNRLENQESIWQGIYVGVKFVVLLIMSLASFEVEGFIISIACFIFAIISIAIGFWRSYNSLRVFGLVLSMLSIFKLIVVDLSTGETVGNVISFFTAGILCLGISMIYNYIDKKFPNE